MFANVIDLSHGPQPLLNNHGRVVSIINFVTFYVSLQDESPKPFLIEFEKCTVKTICELFCKYV